MRSAFASSLICWSHRSLLSIFIIFIIFLLHTKKSALHFSISISSQIFSFENHIVFSITHVVEKIESQFSAWVVFWILRALVFNETTTLWSARFFTTSVNKTIEPWKMRKLTSLLFAFMKKLIEMAP